MYDRPQLEVPRRSPVLWCPKPKLTMRAVRSLAGEVHEKQPRAKPKEWYEKGEADMNNSEVLFNSLLLTKSAESAPNGRAELEKWSSAVLSEERRATELQSLWKPPNDKRTSVDFFGPLEHVHTKRSWPRPELNTIGLAMQAWRGEAVWHIGNGSLSQSRYGT